MAAHIVVTLDTTGPQIEWGVLSGGPFVDLPYILDEGQITAAYLVDNHGGHTSLEVRPDTLWLNPLPDLPGGPGFIEAHAIDEVGNQTISTYPYVIEQGDWFIVTLDTTPPVISWGTPIGNTPGSEISFPYTINEPGIISAQIRDANNNVYAAHWDSGHIYATPPVIGSYVLEVLVKDDVNNQVLRTLAFTAGVQPSTGFGGSPGRFTYGAGVPAWIKIDEEHPGLVILSRSTKLEFSGEVSLARTKSIPLTIESSLARKNAVQLECSRDAAHHYLQLADEDELLMML